MISVTIKINQNVIYHRSAVNVTEKLLLGRYGKGKQTYEVDTGKLIEHKFEDGAVKLVLKLLRTIKEVK